MSFGGSDRSVNSARNLGSLFGGSAAKEDRSTRSLAYTAPKEPTKSTGATAAVDKTADLENKNSSKNTAVQYAYVGRTRLYKLEQSSFVPASPEHLGCVVLGTGAAYQLLVYDARKRRVLAASIAEVAPILPQANGYNTFSCQGSTWSAYFENEGSYDFCRSVALCHCALQTRLTSYNLLQGEGDLVVEKDDSVTISSQTWQLDLSGIPTALARTDPPSAESSRVVVAGDEEDAIARALVGAKSGSKLGIVVENRWVEVVIVHVVKEQPTPPPPEVVDDDVEVSTQRSNDQRPSIAERMAGLAAAGGVVGVLPPPSSTVRQGAVEATESPPPSTEKESSPQISAVAPETRTSSHIRDDGNQATSASSVATRSEEQQQSAMLAMQSSMQTQSTLLALQASLSQVHEKLDRALNGGSSSPQSSSLDDDNLEALESRVSRVLRDHASLRSKVVDRDTKRSELEEKLESLREKNSQLVGEKLAIMEKHAEMLSKGNDETIRARAVQEASRDAVKERDRLLERIETIESERLVLSDSLAEEQERSAELRRQLDEKEEKPTANDGVDAAEETSGGRGGESDELLLLSSEVEQLKAAAAFLEKRCEEAEKKAQSLSWELDAARQQRDSALAAAGAVDSGSSSRNNKDGPAAAEAESKTDDKNTDDLVKKIMNETYRQLCAYVAQAGGGRPDASFSASDVVKAIKATLKNVTAKYLVGGAKGN